MTEVACKILADHLDYMRAKGLATASLIAALQRRQGGGFEMREDFLTEPANRVSWSVYVDFLELWEEACGGAAVCEPQFIDWSLGRHARWTRVLGPVTKVLISPTRLYELIVKWGGPMMFSNIQASCVALSSGGLDIRYALRPGDRDAAGFFRLCAHAIRRAPSLFGYPDSAVECVSDARTSRFLVTPPLAMSLYARLRRRVRAVLSLSSLLDEFASRDLEVRDHNAKLLTARAGLEADVRQRTLDLERANQALQERLQILGQVETLAHVGSWTWEPGSDAVTLSDEAARIFGLAPGSRALTAVSLLDQVHPDDRAAMAAMLAHGRAGEVVVSEHRLLVSDAGADGGGIRHVQVRGGAVLGAADQALRLVGTVMDVTPQRQHERALVAEKEAADAANLSKTTFLASMSHEIRTPMTSVLGFADLLARDDLPAAKRQTYVDKILRNGRHLLALIDDVLDLSKIEAGHLIVHCSRFAPAAEIIHAVDLLRQEADRKGLSLAVEHDASFPETMVSDQVRFRQILLNLVANAIKYTDQGGVTIWAGRREGPGGSLLDVVVRDTGVGIAAEHHQALFQAFSQANVLAARPRGGSGLGLALARKLARALGGDVELIASRRGEGSAFRAFVRLELEAAGARPSVSLGNGFTLQLGAAGCLDGFPAHTRVLVVEDNLDIQEIVRRVLESIGVDVTTAANGEEALTLAGAAPFDLVVMDMQMPVLDGLEATVRLRSRGFTAPIVAITALAMAGEREKYLAAGCNDFLSKPVEALTLIRTVAKWVGAAPAGRPAADPRPYAD